MKSILSLIFFSLVPIMSFAQTKVLLSIGNKSISATLVDNEATRALISTLSEKPITVNMSDYGGFEKVGALPQSYPTSNTQITTEPGDIMLYQGNNIVIFYGSNTWSYTRLGKIDNATVGKLREFLGNGDIKMTISLDSTLGITETYSVNSIDDIVYDIKGKLITTRPIPPGVYIINGNKNLIK